MLVTAYAYAYAYRSGSKIFPSNCEAVFYTQINGRIVAETWEKTAMTRVNGDRGRIVAETRWKHGRAFGAQKRRRHSLRLLRFAHLLIGDRRRIPGGGYEVLR